MKRRGYASISVALIVILISILAGGSLWNVNMIRHAQAEQLREACNAIDRSLEMWSKSHRAIKEDTVRYQDGRVFYEKKRIYPATLQELKELGYIGRGMDISVMRYSTQDNEKYRLEVYLPTGDNYVSRGSKF